MEWWHLGLSFGGMLLASGAVYGGIRADLRNFKEKLDHQRQAIELMQRDGCGPCRGRRQND